ncbi:hypothetical protein MJO29_003838 [Puccinia striiformis f. sp. tritici]|uniref:Uncharacterized protein n=1 Tax=Puccinia striiformis TaxID=27350 RepID=A0A2S4W9Z6_9BASI|nr:hypothetical protein MJO29_003838 [Puccinia striiformis f. sp. tritici]POW18580.1 hypothetical protein PSHT_05662 [Puccinia striiformis]
MVNNQSTNQNRGVDDLQEKDGDTPITITEPGQPAPLHLAGHARDQPTPANDNTILSSAPA